MKSANVVRWTARALSGVILLVWGVFLVAHALASEGSPRPLVWRDYAILGALVVSLAGLAAAWKWEAAGAVTTLVALAACAALNWRVLVFPGALIPVAAMLFLVAWALGKARPAAEFRSP